MSEYSAITSQDQRRIRGYLRRAVTATCLGDLEQQFLEEMQRLIGFELATWDNFRKDNQGVLYMRGSKGFLNLFSKYEETFNHTVATHPVLSRGGWEAIDMVPQRMSDWTPPSKLQNVPLYQDFYRHIGADYQLGIRFARLSDRNLVITVNRTSRDFSERESQLVQCLSTALGQIAQALDHKKRLHTPIEAITNHFRRDDDSLALDQLTTAEVRLLGRIACGEPVQQIAHQENLSKHTLYKAGEAIREKLNLENNRQLKALFNPDPIKP